MCENLVVELHTTQSRCPVLLDVVSHTTSTRLRAHSPLAGLLPLVRPAKLALVLTVDTLAAVGGRAAHARPARLPSRAMGRGMLLRDAVVAERVALLRVGVEHLPPRRRVDQSVEPPQQPRAVHLPHAPRGARVGQLPCAAGAGGVQAAVAGFVFDVSFGCMMYMRGVWLI